MHSRIFELLENREEVTLGHNLIDVDGDIWPMDYIYDINADERKDDIEWFVPNLIELGAIYNDEEESIIFPKGFQVEYFKDKFSEFKRLAEEMTIEKFSGVERDNGSLYSIGKAIEDEFGFYIAVECTLITLDDFIRYYESDKKYYIGNIYGYHA